ncbi:MAG: TonB-dependent siderophore receptor [Pseudoxanthomonas sp.]
MSNAFRSRAGFPRVSLLSACLLIAAHAHAEDAAAADADATDLDRILVVAQRAERVSSGAVNLDLAIKDTPQSISVVTAEQMQQFGADSVNEALKLATGIQVDEWETNRTTYSARGFDILNTQIDGVGLPNSWGIATGAFDAFGYEKIEVIRGANGLLTGVGNAAGTLNYVRKRPTNEEQGTAGISYGSWGTVRVQGDYSSPITDDGRWAARIVVAHEDGESYLRANENKRDFLYGVIDGQLGENGTLTVGFSSQDAKSNGVMWGALVFDYSNGTQAQWPTSATTTQDWTYWNTLNQAGFAEYTHRLGESWQFKLSYNYRLSDGKEKMFFAYDPLGVGLDPETNLGLYGYPWAGKDKLTAHLGTATLNGSFDLFGREHEAMLGVSAARSESTSWERSAYDYSEPAWGALPAFPYATNAIPEPAWSDYATYAVLEQRLKRAFGAARISLSDRLKAIVGVNYADYRREGESYGVSPDPGGSHTSPYGGLTFDFSDNILGYVSYSDIYQPQDQYDADGNFLDASQGTNHEIGIKADWLDKRLLTTLAVFKANQDGLATPTGTYNEYGQYVYAPVDVESEGVEFEAVGKLTDNLDLVLGLTALKLDGSDGDDTYPWVPRRTANFMLSGRLPAYRALSWGIGGRWQGEVFNIATSGTTIRQGSYAVLNAFAAWDVLPNLTLRANVNNIADEKYINTLRYSGFYGAPRNYTLSLDWKF